MTRRRRLRNRRRVSLGLLVFALAASPAFALADVPSPVAVATTADDQLSTARTRLEAAEARLVALEQERASIEADHGTLDTNQLALARQLESAMRDTRQFAVEAYVAGGPSAPIGEVLAANDVVDAIWRSEVLAGQTTHGLEKAGELRDLLERADSAVRQIALRSDQNRRKVEAATIERFFATIANKSAEQRLAIERAPVALTVNATAAPQGSLAEAWAKLRHCEATDNYRAISPSGLYRGAYQFDQRTWEAVGGSGDPIDAAPAEQDLRAQILYDRRGRQPWPVCGRFLP
jgi:hypothetical protein